MHQLFAYNSPPKTPKGRFIQEHPDNLIPDLILRAMQTSWC